MWERYRLPYRFASGGPGSGIYKSTDAGKTWKKLTKGLPTATMGRVGLSYYKKNPRIVMAEIEAAEKGGIYRSEDGGENWTYMSNTNPRPFYFSQIRIDPNDDKRVYVCGTNFHVSDDAGKTFRAMRISIHVDFHACWVDPNDSNHVMVGEDGGLGNHARQGGYRHTPTRCASPSSMRWQSICASRITSMAGSKTTALGRARPRLGGEASASSIGTTSVAVTASMSRSTLRTGAGCTQ